MSGGDMSEQIKQGYLDARRLIETETARLAAINRSNDDLYRLFLTLREGQSIDENDLSARAAQEFKFHKLVAVASGNSFYPVFINSMEETALNLLKTMYCPAMTKSEALKLQELLYEAILERNPEKSTTVMQNMFEHRRPE